MPTSACCSAITSGVAIRSVDLHSNHAVRDDHREGVDGDVRRQVQGVAGPQVESRPVPGTLDRAVLGIELSVHQLAVVVRATVLDRVHLAVAVEYADLEVCQLDEKLLAGLEILHGADVDKGAHENPILEVWILSSRAVAPGPLIGVTTSEVRRAEHTHPLPEGEPLQHEMALGMPYVRALQRAGAIPVVLPPLPPEAVPALVAQLAGVCLSGGPDLDPSAYGASPSADLGPTEPGLDVFELEVARCADAAGLPILGICRGCQALNVARGGTLYQHLPAVTDGSVHPRQTAPGWEETHAVRVEPGSRLARVLSEEELQANSFHHQAVERLGSGLRAVAWAPDGTVEAI